MRFLSILAFVFLATLGTQNAAAAAEVDSFTAAMARGPLFAALAALVGGLLVSLTPCVYPMVAVTVSVFGARQSRSRWEGAGLSAAFVGGIVAMFVPLGVMAGLTGSVFGSVLQSRWVLIGLAVLFLAMAAAMFGAFEFGLPSLLTNRLARVGGIGLRGAFALGLACGLIASPCTGPVLTGILAHIAQSQDAIAGAAAMSAFSLGLGAPFFVVGTFAVQLPKSGPWMVKVKSLLGLILVVVALYYLGTTFPRLTSWMRPSAPLLLTSVVLLVAGMLLGAVHRDFADKRRSNRMMKGVGIMVTSAALFTLVSVAAKPTGSLRWEPTGIEKAESRALAAGQPMIVDFTAAWCGACKELDKHTFADPRVAAEAARFVAVKVDATHDDDPEVARVLARFAVRGLPTVLLFDAKGKEVRRFTDFVGPDDFLAALRSVE